MPPILSIDPIRTEFRTKLRERVERREITAAQLPEWEALLERETCIVTRSQVQEQYDTALIEHWVADDLYQLLSQVTDAFGKVCTEIENLTADTVMDADAALDAFNRARRDFAKGNLRCAEPQSSKQGPRLSVEERNRHCAYSIKLRDQGAGCERMLEGFAAKFTWVVVD